MGIQIRGRRRIWPTVAAADRFLSEMESAMPLLDGRRKSGGVSWDRHDSPYALLRLRQSGFGLTCV